MNEVRDSVSHAGKKPSFRVILHGKQSQNAEVRECVQQLQGDGLDIDVRPTWQQGDAARLAEEAVELGIGNIVAAGGDGTVNEVVQGLLHAAHGGDRSMPHLGILPLGTANDFACSANIPTDDCAAALRIAVSGPTSLVDVIEHGPRAFLNVATGGFATEITRDTPENLKMVFGKVAYFVTGLSKLGAVAVSRARLRVDDFEWSGTFIMLALGNARQAGGGRVLCPEATIDDGKVDVAILSDEGQDDLMGVLGKLATDGFESFPERVVRARGRRVLVEADEELTLNFDGEPVTEKEFELLVAPGALSLRLPEGCPLLGER